jgi:hypothetical protein
MRKRVALVSLHVVEDEKSSPVAQDSRG